MRYTDLRDIGSKLGSPQRLDLDGYEWFQFGLVVMAEKIMTDANPAYWQGEWKDASHHYVSVQIRKNGLSYNGWVEVSMNKLADKMILDKAAISKEANKDVLAGY